VKTTAFDMQLNPATPGMQFHKLEKARDKNFWSVRVNSDIRLIVHKTAASLLLCYVDHHDKAYDWAERRKLETHPRTGAAQLVEIRETVQEIVIPTYIEADTSRPKPSITPLFAHCSDDELLGYGIPVEWIPDVRAATEDSLSSFRRGCRGKRPGPSSSWRPAASRVLLPRRPIRSSIRTRSGASG
jgi:hypothetical protein